MHYNFLGVSLTYNLQKAIETNNNMMFHYRMICMSAAMTIPKTVKLDYLSRSIYDQINQSNLESNHYLKSVPFLDSFHEYMKSVIKLYSITKSVSYPAAATASLLDKYNAALVFRGFLEMNETLHEVVCRMEDVRLQKISWKE